MIILYNKFNTSPAARVFRPPRPLCLVYFKCTVIKMSTLCRGLIQATLLEIILAPVTSPPEGVARYCFHPVCLSVCLSVCVSVCVFGQYFGILFLGYLEEISI